MTSNVKTFVTINEFGTNYVQHKKVKELYK